MAKLELKDAHGREILVGATVTIPPMPDWLVKGLPLENVAKLREVEGENMRVLEVDSFGYLWFGQNNEGSWFCLRPDEVVVVE